MPGLDLFGNDSFLNPAAVPSSSSSSSSSSRGGGAAPLPPAAISPPLSPPLQIQMERSKKRGRISDLDLDLDTGRENGSLSDLLNGHANTNRRKIGHTSQKVLSESVTTSPSSKNSRKKKRKKEREREKKGFVNGPRALGMTNGNQTEAAPASSSSLNNQPSSSSSSVPVSTSSAMPALAAEKLLESRKRLPIWNARDAILEKIEENETIVLLADTGSGKSTQIPQFLHHAGYTSSTPSRRMIGITQPRRMAALTLAKRVAQEMGTSDPGSGQPKQKGARKQPPSQVGYAIRFQERTTKYTRIKFMTDGYLLREFIRGASKMREEECSSLDEIADAEHPALMPQYSVLVIDEAHERSVRSDLLLGLAKRIQARRRQLRVEYLEKVKNGDAAQSIEPQPLRIVIMSATLDAEIFSRFFSYTTNGEEVVAPVVYVKGRTYPVTLYHLLEPASDWIDAAKRQVLQIHITRALTSGGGGDVLVFGTGAEEIEALTSALRQLSDQLPQWASEREKTTGQKTSIGKLLVVPLYAALGSKAVNEVYRPTPPGTRKVVVATNIAETSVTIPGVRFVVDCGLAKEKIHISHGATAAATGSNGSASESSHRSNAGLGIETLTTRAISQSAATQRAGRAGREAPGECYRLYPKAAFEVMELTTVPEIHRTELTSVALDACAAGVDPRQLEWVEAPDEAKLGEAVFELAATGAIVPAKRTTLSSAPNGAEGEENPVDATSDVAAASDPHSISVHLSSLGQRMSTLPLPPRFSLLLIHASSSGSVTLLLQARDLISILSSERNLFLEPSFSTADAAREGKDPLEWLEDKRMEVEVSRSAWRHESGDHVTLLRAFRGYLKVKRELQLQGDGRKSNGDSHAHTPSHTPSPADALKTWCNKHFLSLRALREMEDIREQLTNLLRRDGHLPRDSVNGISGAGENNKGGNGSFFAEDDRSDLDQEGDSSDSEGEVDPALTVIRSRRQERTLTNHDVDDDDDDDDGEGGEEEDYTPLLRILVKGRAHSNVARLVSRLSSSSSTYRRLGGAEEFKLHPTCALHSRYRSASQSTSGWSSTSLILFEELVYTTALYARMVSTVGKVEWLDVVDG